MNNGEISISSVELVRILDADRTRSLCEFCKLVGIKIKDEISQRQAFKLFGEGNIHRWENRGSIASRRTGTGRNSKIIYSKSQIEYMKKIESIIRLR